MSTDNFGVRLHEIAENITLGMACRLRVEKGDDGRWFMQIKCWRMDVITEEHGWGYGGKYYPSVHASTSEIVAAVFGLYRSYWEHEARETFKYRDRRIFGPHISVEALWDAAPHVDVRSAQHAEANA